MSDRDRPKPDFLSKRETERYFRVNASLFEFARQFEYDEPNDRAIVIVGAAYLDDLLYEVLSAFFIEDETEPDKLLEPEGALGSFGSRIRACLCLGLIGERVTRDLRLIAKIRNRFAHKLSASFEDREIVSWCKALRWHYELMGEPPPDATVRDLFQVGVHQLGSNLQGVVSIARCHKRVKVEFR